MRHLPFAFAIVLATTLLSAPAADRGPEDVVGAIHHNIHDFYRNWRNGNVDAAFNHIAVGSSGFLGSGGMMHEIPDRETHSRIVQEYQSYYDSGFKWDGMPKHITIDAHDDWAVAEFYLEGTTQMPDAEPEPFMMRETLVWAADRHGDWKIHHWHMSKLEMEK